MRNINVVNTSFFIVFSILALLGTYQHEIWLDEAHHWLLARDSRTLNELWTNVRYEGHPLLWNFLLFAITRFTTDVATMQFVHVLIVIIAVYIFIFYSPFTPLEKFLFIFGYFILYEYAVISRNYALLILFLFFSIVLYRRERYTGLGVSLALLANTHLFGLLIASSFVVMIAVEIASLTSRRIERQHFVAFTIFALGAILSVLQIVPPSDSLLYTYGQRSPLVERVGRTSVVFLKCFLPFPDVTNYRFWNTNLLMSWSKPVSVMLSLILAAYPALIFRNRLSLLIYFYSGAALMLSFICLTDHNASRYYGIIYFIFISALWLARELISTQNEPVFQYSKPLQKIVSRVFIVLLFVHAISGITSLTLDITRPFSESKHTANRLIQEKDIPLYLAGGCGAAPVSAYLGESIYYLNVKKVGSFCHFNRSDGQVMYDDQRNLLEAIEFANKNKQPALFITHEPVKIPETHSGTVKLIASYEKSILRNENYFIYKIANK